jgi:hypothetical protein
MENKIYGAIRLVDVDDEIIKDFLKQFGTVVSFMSARENSCTTFEATYSDDNLIVGMLLSEHEIQGAAVTISRESGTVQAELADRSSVPFTQFSFTYTESSPTIALLDTILSNGVSPIDGLNIRAYRSALLQGELNSHQGKYVIVNHGIVQLDDVCDSEEATIGKFSSQYSMVFHVPSHPHDDHLPIYDQRALQHCVEGTRTDMCSPLVVKATIDWAFRMDDGEGPITACTFLYDTGASTTSCPGVIVNELPLRIDHQRTDASNTLTYMYETVPFWHTSCTALYNQSIVTEGSIIVAGGGSSRVRVFKFMRDRPLLLRIGDLEAVPVTMLLLTPHYWFKRVMTDAQHKNWLKLTGYYIMAMANLQYTTRNLDTGLLLGRDVTFRHFNVSTHTEPSLKTIATFVRRTSTAYPSPVEKSGAMDTTVAELQEDPFERHVTQQHPRSPTAAASQSCGAASGHAQPPLATFPACAVVVNACFVCIAYFCHRF